MVDRRPQDYANGEPDGLTDNTVAIQAAIDAWTPGDRVVLTGGQFRTTGTLLIPDNDLILVGDGAIRAKTLPGVWDDQFMLHVTGTGVQIIGDGLGLDQADIIVSGVSVEADGAAGLRVSGVISRGTQLAFLRLGTNASDIQAVEIDHLGKGYGVLCQDAAGVSDLMVRDSVFEHVGSGSAGDGMQLNCPTSGAANVEVIACTARGMIGEATNRGMGFGFSRVTDGRIIGCLVEDCEGDAFHFEGTSHRWLCADLVALRIGQQGPVGGNGSGLVVYDSDDVTVMLSAFVATGYHGVAFSGQGTTVGTGGQLQTGNEVIRCHIDSTARDGVHFTAQDGALADRCYIRDPSVGNPGIYAGIRAGRQGGTAVECQNSIATGCEVVLSGETTPLAARFVRTGATGCDLDGVGPSAAPVAVDDTGLTVVEETFADFHVLSNDTFIHGTETLTVLDDPTFGTAELQPNGKIRYTTTGYTGADSFTYRLFDAAGQDDGTVSIDVVSDGEPDGDPWDDGTFWTDGTGWVEAA